MKVSIVNIPTAVVFAVALAALFYFKSKITIPLVVAGAALAGFAMTLLNP
jgi:chromate transporter